MDKDLGTFSLPRPGNSTYSLAGPENRTSIRSHGHTIMPGNLKNII